MENVSRELMSAIQKLKMKQSIIRFVVNNKIPCLAYSYSQFIMVQKLVSTRRSKNNSTTGQFLFGSSFFI